ncbi:hypothetical protein B0H17DRAFT_1145330 [Mycena rosella]|uniref:Uncharacterized protein n=1 Tax=Mycena rosella TaxID=1033263 RepID=A0AAD7CU04_MYCRO|nr:hypothetical protein B0H17DRAFT_1145330 [Mycena rosella]
MPMSYVHDPTSGRPKIEPGAVAELTDNCAIVHTRLQLGESIGRKSLSTAATGLQSDNPRLAPSQSAPREVLYVRRVPTNSPESLARSTVSEDTVGKDCRARGITPRRDGAPTSPVRSGASRIALAYRDVAAAPRRRDGEREGEVEFRVQDEGQDDSGSLASSGFVPWGEEFLRFSVAGKLASALEREKDDAEEGDRAWKSECVQGDAKAEEDSSVWRPARTAPCCTDFMGSGGEGRGQNVGLLKDRAGGGDEVPVGRERVCRGADE